MKWCFRGFDAIGKKGWVYGDLVHNQKVTKDGLEPRVMVGGYEVVPESVGICTGFKDKKGKDVYEGDIVSVDDKEGIISSGFCTKHCVVEYIDYGMNFVMIGRTSRKYPGEKVYISVDQMTFEVIGNIYQNKELLENG